MQILYEVADLRAARAGLAGRVGVVPTMGALHAGHLALVERARMEMDGVLVTVFVNPTQFAAHEDLARYPRDLPHDLALLRAAGVDAVFAPSAEVMYPPAFQTWVQVEGVSQGLEGERRPGHFRGVATVVAKLFNLCQPHAAYFGQKDAQQVVVIKQMVRDLNFPVEIVVCPTVREADGLAMSSRNVYLDADQRRAAGVVYRALRAAAADYEVGERRPDALRRAMLATVAEEPSVTLEYASAADARTLRELDKPATEPILLSLAVRLGTTRLIDNLLLPTALNNRHDLSRTLGGDSQ